VKEYIKERGWQFNRIDEVETLGKGGESIVFRVIPYLPVEIVAKIPITTTDSSMNAELFRDLLMEDHLLKMRSHQDYIC